MAVVVMVAVHPIAAQAASPSAPDRIRDAAAADAPVASAAELLDRAVAGMRDPSPRQAPTPASTEPSAAALAEVLLVDAGDLDADGAPDMLIGAVARSSRTGRALWQAPVGPELQPAGLDLDGVPGDDLLSVELVQHDVVVQECEVQPDGSAVCRPRHVELVWRVGAVSGASGRPLWTRDVPGTYRRTTTGDDINGTTREESNSVVVYPKVVLTAGRPSIAVIHQQTSASTSWEAGIPLLTKSTERDVRRTATTIDHYRPFDGVFVSRVVIGPEPARRATVSVVDLAGDGTSELLAVTETRTDFTRSCTNLVVTTTDCTEAGGEDGLATALIDPGTGAAVWSSHVSGGTCCWIYGSTSPVGDDLDGDGVEDLWRSYVDFGDTAASDAVVRSVLSGRDGRRLYDLSAATYVQPIGKDLDGDGGDDIVAFASSHDDQFDETVRVQRRNGRTGQLIAETLYAPSPDPEREEWFFPYAVEDVDGDGAGDVVVIEEAVVVRDSQPQDEMTTWTMESGASGSRLWRLATPEIKDVGMVPHPGSSGRAADVVLTTRSAAGAATISLASGSTGRIAWAQSVPGKNATAFPVADLDGDGLTEIGVVTDIEDQRAITMLRGSTGSTMWSAQSS